MNEISTYRKYIRHVKLTLGCKEQPESDRRTSAKTEGSCSETADTVRLEKPLHSFLWAPEFHRLANGKSH